VLLQALEVGLTPGGVARHLINLALLRHGRSEEQLLPPPPKPETAASAQWAQATGVNDTLADITQQLADAAVEAREEADNAELQVGINRLCITSQADSLSCCHVRVCTSQHRPCFPTPGPAGICLLLSSRQSSSGEVMAQRVT
jgi:hypothetical protein